MTGLICCTLECNLACTYCYEGNGLKKDMPSLKCVNIDFEKGIDKFIAFIDELYEYNEKTLTEIIWHGGEPLLINIELLERVMKDQKAKEHKIRWAMQTNGTLLTDSVCQVLKKYGVTIGISIDGLKEHHDKFRLMKNGNGTFELIIRNVKNAQSQGIACGALVTITDNNVKDLKEIYYSFAEKKMNFSFNALFPTNEEQNETSLNAYDYVNAICELFRLWVEDDENNIKISPFEQIIEGLLKPKRGIPACHWAKNCSNSFVAIDNKGNLYPCEHWVGDKNFCFGNISQGLKEAIKENDYFSDRVKFLEENDCKLCPIFTLCYGGCPWNGMILSGSHKNKDASICEGRKIIIEYIYEYLKKHLRNNPFDNLSFEEYIKTHS